MGSADRSACKVVRETGQLVGAQTKQSEVLATMITRLETLELASKETLPVPRYREVKWPV